MSELYLVIWHFKEGGEPGTKICVSRSKAMDWAEGVLKCKDPAEKADIYEIPAVKVDQLARLGVK